MLAYFILLLPFAICYGYAMQMIMRRHKNQLLDTVTYLIAGMSIYFLCYSYECNPESSPTSLLVVDLVEQWVTPALAPLSMAIMNGLKRQKMFSKDVMLWFIPSVLLGVSSTLVHTLSLGEEWHQRVCVNAFDIIMCIEMIAIFVSNFIKMGGKNFAWHRLYTFFTRNTSSRPLMVIGVSINVFILLMTERLIVGPASFHSLDIIDIFRLVSISFVLLLLFNTMAQANAPWLTLKSLFDPTVVALQNEEEEDLAEIHLNNDIVGKLPSEINTLPASESAAILDKVDQLAGALHKYMEDEMAFLQPDISIEKVSAHLGTNRFYISRLVNVEQAMSFRDYVNSLRINYAKKYMTEHPDATQEQIAEECGFSSASYFNRKFKQTTGLSPQDWKNS